MTPRRDLNETDKVVPLPVVDIGNLVNMTREEFDLSDPKLREIAENIGAALRDHGFMYLSNHGISEKLVSQAFEESRQFFNLPLEIKEKYAKGKGSISNFHGYSGTGTEILDVDNNDVKEWKETYDFYPLGEHSYPDEEVPNFRPTIQEMEKVCKDLEVKLLRLVAVAVGLEDTDYFYNRCLNIVDLDKNPGRSGLRTIYYPPIPEDMKNSGTWIGCNEHTDWGVLTLLFQDSVGGLEVKTAQGEWVKATPIPNTIICNTGGILEKWTGGYLPATFHRVHVKPVKRSECLNGETPIARQSFGFFLQPDESALVEPVKRGFVPDDHPIMKPVLASDYFHERAIVAYGRKESQSKRL